MGDLQDQLKNLFPDQSSPDRSSSKKEEEQEGLWIQEAPLHCKYEKRHGKPITLIEGYTGTKADFKQLAKEIKAMHGVGGSVKNDQIIIQGDFRPQIMKFLKGYGFKVKRVGG